MDFADFEMVEDMAQPYKEFCLMYGLEVCWQTRDDLVRRPKLKKIICQFSLNAEDMLSFQMPSGLWKMVSNSEKSGELCKKGVVLPIKLI